MKPRDTAGAIYSMYPENGNRFRDKGDAQDQEAKPKDRDALKRIEAGSKAGFVSVAGISCASGRITARRQSYAIPDIVDHGSRPL
jgi:hypothetical protein